MIKRGFGFAACLFSMMLMALSCGQVNADADIETRVGEKIQSLQGYDAVQYNVRNGIVFLTGQCVGEGCAQNLEKQLQEVDGVMAVENDISEGVPVGR